MCSMACTEARQVRCCSGSCCRRLDEHCCTCHHLWSCHWCWSVLSRRQRLVQDSSRHFHSSHRPSLFLGLDALSRSWRGSVLSQCLVGFGPPLCHSWPNLTKSWPRVDLKSTSCKVFGRGVLFKRVTVCGRSQSVETTQSMQTIQEATRDHFWHDHLGFLVSRGAPRTLFIPLQGASWCHSLLASDQKSPSREVTTKDHSSSNPRRGSPPRPKNKSGR